MVIEFLLYISKIITLYLLLLLLLCKNFISIFLIFIVLINEFHDYKITICDILLLFLLFISRPIPEFIRQLTMLREL